jgi:hypothetical protein
MASTSVRRPGTGEYDPHYETYIKLLPEPELDLNLVLKEQMKETHALLKGVKDDKANFAYAPGKWTVKEVVGHMSDVERVMSYRALCIARSDHTPLPSFDENAWVPAAKFGRLELHQLLDEFMAVRQATIHLLNELEPEAFQRKGTASNKSISVRALFYIIAGHERHHVKLFHERYGF